MIRHARQCPVGILAEVSLADEHPERKTEIRDLAIARRERDLIVAHESRTMLSWHPLTLLKTLLIVGVVTFSTAWSVSQISAFGHWYADARTSKLNVSIPLIGKESFPVGEYLPTSTAMTTIQSLPAWSINESLLITAAVMALVLIERLVMIAIAWKKIRQLHHSEEAIRQELEQIREWMA